MKSLEFRYISRALVLTAVLGTLNTPIFASQNQASNKDWTTIQNLLKNIHGISTTPPANLITPKYTSGALMGNGDIGIVAGDTSTSRQTFHFGKSDFWGTHWNTRHNAPEVSILSLGDLMLSSPKKATDDTSVYRVDQDILHAQVETTLKLAGETVHLLSWTAENKNIFITKIATEGHRSLPIQLTLTMPDPKSDPHITYPAAAGNREGNLWASRENDLTGATDYKVRAAIAVRVLGATLGNFASSSSNSTSASFILKNEPVWVVTVFQSDARMNLNGPSSLAIVQTALEQAASISPSNIDNLYQDHLNWWKNFWLKSFIQMNDKVLEDYYYGALYVLGASSRPGKLAPSLWSNFITTDNAGWGGRYFMNYNEEAPYYGSFSSNRPELAEPYNNMVLAQIPWQKNRTAVAGYKGISYQRTFSPSTIIATPPAPIPIAAGKDYKKLPSDQKSNATFSFLPSIQFYEYTQNTEFLRTQLYPAMKELDAFWRDFAVRDPSNQHWVFEHSSAHEGGDDINPNLDIGFARRIERELITTSKILGTDEEMRPVWQSFLDQLSPYPSGVVNGKTVYYIAASVRNEIKNQGLFEPGDQPINLEGVVYPGENLAIGDDPTQLEMARNSMQEMNSWGVSKGGNSNNGFCKIFPIAARIGWPADDLVAKLKAAILYQWRPSNLTVFQGGGGIETSGSIEALDSMLLQHENGILRVFPDWPPSKDASFTRLRAKGAFLVSSEQRNGRITNINIFSEHGGQLTIQSPWKTSHIRVNNQTLPLNDKGQITLNTEANTPYHLVAQ